MVSSHFERYESDFGETPGWFSLQSAALWDALLDYQQEASIAGHLLEIGVWKGRSAALSTLHAAPDEQCVFVDRSDLADARRLLTRIRATHLQFLQMDSFGLAQTELVRETGAAFRWVHLDAGHTGPAVTSDLSVADMLLSERGVIAIDDFMSVRYPQVTQAVFRWLEAHPGRLQLFLCGSNKAYLCRPAAAHPYLSFVKDRLYAELKARGCGNVTLHKTTDPADMNCFGIGPRVEDFDYRGPDGNANSITI